MTLQSSLRRLAGSAVVLTLSWVCCASTAYALTFPSPTRQEVSLAGDWQYRVMPDEKPSYPPPTDAWKPVKMPGTLGGTKPDDRIKGVFLNRSFAVPRGFRGKHIRLEFDSVSRWCKVYLNGRYLGENYSGIPPFSFDVTGRVAFDKPNEVLLWITPEHEPRTDTDTYGYPVLPGINRRAALAAYPRVRVEDVFIKPSFRKKQLDLDIALVNNSGIEQKVALANSVVSWTKSMDLDRAKSVLACKHAGAIVLKPGERKLVTITQPWRNPHLWSHEDPFLYVLRTSLTRPGSGELIDSTARRFGFREFWTEGTSFILNGVKVHLYGTWSGSGRTNFEAMRRSNMNAIRCPHSPHGWDPNTLDDADEVGILICCQNAALGFSDPYRDRPEFWNNMEDVYRRAVRRDRNHPSVVMWSMSNEWVQTARDKWQQQVDGLWRLQQAVRQEDPTRPAFQSGSGALNGRGEVISLHYPREIVYGGPVIGFGAGDAPDGSYWLESAKEWHSGWLQYNEPAGTKPVIISESTHIWPAIQDYDSVEVYYHWLGEKGYEYAHDWTDNRTPRAWSQAFEEIQVAHWPFVAGIRDSGIGGVLVNGEIPSFRWRAPNWARAFAPVVLNCRQMDSRFFIGDKVERTLTVYNDLMVGKSDVLVRWEAKLPFRQVFGSGEYKCRLAGGERSRFDVEFTVADAWQGKPFYFEFGYEVYVNGKCKFEEKLPMAAYPRAYPKVAIKGPVGLFDPLTNTAPVLAKLGLDTTPIAHFDGLAYPAFTTLVIGKNALSGQSFDKLRMPDLAKKLSDFTSAGGFVVVLDQDEFPSDLLPVQVNAMADTSPAHFATTASILAPNHSVLDKLTDSDFRFWRGDHFVARHTLVKPLKGGAIPLLGNGNGSTPNVDCTPLLEIRSGKGGYMISQLLLVDKFETEPNASAVLANILNYARSNAWGPRAVSVLLSDTDSGPRTAGYLSAVGLQAKPALAPDLGGDGLVVVGMEKDFPSSERMAALRLFVERGGTVLALGAADRKDEIAALLGEPYSVEVDTRPISTRSQPVKAGASPLLDGISNADMHWRGTPAHQPYVQVHGPRVTHLVDPPLLTEIGIGRGKIVLCQIPLASGAAKETLAYRVGSILLTNLGATLAQSPEPVLPRESLTYFDLRQFANMGFKDEVAGDKRGGWTDQAPFDARTIPTGLQKFRGVTFDVIDPATNGGKSCIVLRGGDKPYFPLSVDNMPARGRFDSLYLLIANAWTSDKPQAKLTVRYVDMYTEDVSIAGGIDVGDWVGPARDLPNAEVAWSGSNGTNSATLYMVQWRNPKPDREVLDISFTSEGNGIPILLAVTGVKR